eukprot:351159-Chlamydomonas_euryale.AAC.5
MVPCTVSLQGSVHQERQAVNGALHCPSPGQCAPGVGGSFNPPLVRGPCTPPAPCLLRPPMRWRRRRAGSAAGALSGCSLRPGCESVKCGSGGQPPCPLPPPSGDGGTAGT